MTVTLTCPRCTRTTTLLDTDPVECPFCEGTQKSGVQSVRVYLPEDPHGITLRAMDSLVTLGFLGFLAMFLVGGVLAWLGLL